MHDDQKTSDYPPKPDHVPASPEVEARVDAAVEAGRINDKRNPERDALVTLLKKVLVFNTGDSDPTEEWEALCNEIRAHLVGGGE